MSHEDDNEENRAKQVVAQIKELHRQSEAQILVASQEERLQSFVQEVFPSLCLPTIKRVAETVLQMFEGDRFYGKMVTRKTQLTSAAKNFRKALKAIDQLDIRTVSGWVEAAADQPGVHAVTLYGESPVERWLSMQLALQCVEGLAKHFEQLASAAPRARVGRPTRSDAVAFGVEALAALYATHRHEKPTFSLKKNGFGDVCRQFFAIVRPGLDAEVDQAVRTVIANRASTTR